MIFSLNELCCNAVQKGLQRHCQSDCIRASMNTLSCARFGTLAGAFLCPERLRGGLLMLALSFALGAPSAENNPNPPTGDLTELPLEALMNLEVPKVYAASKLEQKTTEAPASTTIITSDEIKKFGYRTLADVLQSVQGFNVSYDRNYDFLGAEGISLGDANNRILLLVNGHRVNNNLADGAAIGTDFILDMDLVDRIEIIRGPGAVLYGNNAFLGVINVITRQGGQINGVETSFDYGAFDTYKGRVTFGKQFTNGVNVLLSGSIYESAGVERLFYPQFDTPAQNNGVAQNMDGDSFRSFFGSLGYGDFTLESAFNHREKINPTAQFDLTTFNDPRLRTIDERGYTALKYAQSFPEVVDVTAQVYFDRYTHYIGYPQSFVVGTDVLLSAFTTEHDTGEWWGTELQLNKTLWDRHVLTLGGEYRDDFLQEQRISGQTPVAGSRESYGVYVQGDFAVLTNLHCNAGVRYDQYGDFDPTWDPRLALIYNPLPASTVKAIYGMAFRVPDFEELSDPRFQDIKPEKITSYELVYEQEIRPHLRSSLSGFYHQMDHLIVFDSGSYTNLNAQTKGIELALEGSWTNGIRSRASYSFQSTRDDTVVWRMPDSPNDMFKFNLSVPLVKDKLFAGAEFQYTSGRLSLHNSTDASGQPITVQGEEAGGYGVVNLTLLSQKLIKNVEASASVYNLLNHRYADPASDFHVQDIIEQDGRSFRVKLTYRF
jgi:iron complex outermembrane receptor protein